MGKGTGFRPFYFDLWKNYLNSEYEKGKLKRCNYKAEDCGEKKK